MSGRAASAAKFRFMTQSDASAMAHRQDAPPWAFGSTPSAQAGQHAEPPEFHHAPNKTKASTARRMRTRPPRSSSPTMAGCEKQHEQDVQRPPADQRHGRRCRQRAEDEQPPMTRACTPAASAPGRARLYMSTKPKTGITMRPRSNSTALDWPKKVLVRRGPAPSGPCPATSGLPASRRRPAEGAAAAGRRRFGPRAADAPCQ